MNRHERRSQERHDHGCHHGHRSPAELNQIVEELIAECGEQFAVLAWEGYQQYGRGLVLAVPGQACFVARADCARIALQNPAPVRALVDQYEPRTQVVVLITLPETSQYCEHVRGFTFWPQPPPPLAKKDPLVHVSKDEPHH